MPESSWIWYLLWGKKMSKEIRVSEAFYSSRWNKLLNNHNCATIQNGITFEEISIRNVLMPWKGIQILAEAGEIISLPLFWRKCKVVAIKTINLPEVDGLAIFTFSTCSFCVYKRNLGVNFNYANHIHDN